jgi:hypothetical protein
MPVAMSHDTTSALTGLLILAASIWIGGFVALVVIARVASRTLPATTRVEFFRGVGRSYGQVASLALAAALTFGAILIYDRPWDATLTAAVAVAAALVISTIVGVAQARRMGAARRQALEQPMDQARLAIVQHGARTAAALRALIGALSLTLLALGVLLGS